MTEARTGNQEIRSALSESRRLLMSCGFFSVFVNLLMLTGPVFMLQVYDRVLTSRSEATLVALVIITAFLFLMMGILDHARGRVLARAAARLQARLDPRVLWAILVRSIVPAERAQPATGLRDLEAIQRFASGNGPFAFFDAPWTPCFLCLLFLFHWMLGLFAVFSGCLLVLVALLNQARTGRLQREVGETAASSAHFVEQVRAGSETVRGLGMQDAVIARSGALRGKLLEQTLAASDRNGLFGVTSRTLRLFLQSMMLGLGAWLAIQGQVTFGVIIAASILLGRALAPIDQAVAQWPLLQRALAARRSLSALLEATPPARHRTSLPVPRAKLDVQAITVAAPGTRVPAVHGASFRLEPGQVVGIAGPSAAGKSTLARALVGVWHPIRGSVRLDGADLEQYGSTLGNHIGYLPQEVVLFEGTVAENIARMSPDARDEDIVEAAKRTGAHEMILKLPGGYEFEVSAGGAALSGGQRQRIALARAFFGSPVLVVLDEPDSNLDAVGATALARAIEGHRKRGGAAVIIAHRRGAFAQCDKVFVMEAGRPLPAPFDPGMASTRPLQTDPRTRVRGALPAAHPTPKATGGRAASLAEAVNGKRHLLVPQRHAPIASLLANGAGGTLQSSRTQAEQVMDAASPAPVELTAIGPCSRCEEQDARTPSAVGLANSRRRAPGGAW